MRTTPKVRFYLENRIDKSTQKPKEKKVPILFSLHYGQRFKSTTGLTIDRDLWDAENQRVVASHTHALQINKNLSDLRKELEDIIFDSPPGVLPTSSEISSKLSKNQRSRKGLIDFLDEYIRCKKKELAPNSIKKLETIKRHFQEFGTEKRFRLEFEELDEKFFSRFVDFMIDDKDFRNSYVRKNMVFIKSFLNWSTDKGYNRNLSFKKWKFSTGQKSEKQNEVVALTVKEFLLVYNYQPTTEKLQRIKDFLIFACATGLRYSDVSSLRKIDIDYQENLIRCTTVKTGDSSEIPLNFYSNEILQKYRNTHNFNAKLVDMAIPTISNQKTNDFLKILAKEAGINTLVEVGKYQRNKRTSEKKPKHELICSHTGRKTFVTLSMILGTPPEVIQKITKQRSYKTLQSYIAIDEKSKRVAMEKFSPEKLREFASN